MTTIEQIRKKIEQIDEVIIEKIAEREKLSTKIGQLKRKDNTEIIDVTREKKLFEFYKNLSEKYKLPQTLIKKIFKIIIAHSRQVQEL